MEAGVPVLISQDVIHVATSEDNVYPVWIFVVLADFNINLSLTL